MAPMVRKVIKRQVFEAQTVRKIIKPRRQVLPNVSQKICTAFRVIVLVIVFGLIFFGAVGAVISMVISVIQFLLPPPKEKIIEIEVPESKDRC